MIEIKNLRNEKPKELWDFKVDRTTPLGNPYKPKNKSLEERNRVCDLVEQNFPEIIKDLQIKAYLDTLIRAYKQYGKLNLFCWCAPKRCHAETIRNYILKNVGEI